MKLLLATAVFVSIALGGGLIIGLTNIPDEWYGSLHKPPFTPPNWLFGPVWSILYVLIGIAGARIWIRGNWSPGISLWIAQMVLNFLWSPAFFGLRQPVIALAIIMSMLPVIVLFVIQQWRADRVASMLFLPYAAWVAFASVLNASIVWLN
ncbi:TspO/MBR family protein [Rhizobium ruizarguesonis]|uniref:TspO/MBR family protein n=1 Tax=Rhizobium ruizarguesonis TaxID=2081791 RepID=UPI001030F1C7|nr:TspO/MBR family protein [Rhizobium ruizarguesonis]TAY74171.1 tryptophan-rich sensory protein [Rhizobium ruizarguesonis]